jgi:hypothetical protein
MKQPTKDGGRRDFGLAWLLLCLAFGVHIWDEAAHDFLRYYNATVLTLYSHFSWFPRIDLEFRPWLYGLLGATLILLLLTPFAYRNARWLRPVGYLFAGVQLLNGVNHIILTIRGRSVPSVAFDGPAPGFYTAPLLLVLSVFLFWSLRKTRPQTGVLDGAM